MRAPRARKGETLNPNKALWEKGNFTEVASYMRESGEALVRSLGLTLRGRAGIGAEVIRVDPGASGNRAGLLAGDLITLNAALPAPTPAQVSRAFSAVSQGQRVMIAVTRDDTHFVTTLER